MVGTKQWNKAWKKQWIFKMAAVETWNMAAQLESLMSWWAGDLPDINTTE